MADAAPKTQLGHHQNTSRTFTKFLSSFLYKAVTAILFLVLVPVLTSRPPEFVVLTGRSWEILHIILVIIVVSYGLFVRRREAAGAEEEKNGNDPNPGKFENAHSYVNRFLQLSSLFEDESDGGYGGGSVSDSPSGSDVGRIQFMAWNIQYFRNEPMLVVEEDRNGGSSSARISDKPLLLPIRSLRSCASDDPRGDSGEPGSPPTSFSRSGLMSFRSRVSDDARDGLNAGSISKRVMNGPDHLGESGLLLSSISRFDADPGSIPKRAPRGGSNGPRNVRFCDIGYPESETNMKDGVVLPSPIPWRSRSEKMEMREGVDSTGNTFEANDLAESGSVRPPFSRSLSTTTSSGVNPVLRPATPSLPLLKEVYPPSSLLPMSSEATVVADSVKRKSSSHKSRIPAPPPPPPLLLKTTFKLPSEKPSLVSPRNSQSCMYRDVSRTHPKSVRTIRASAERIQRNVIRKDLGENFFDGVLKNEERKQFFEKIIIKSEDEETESEDADAVASEDPGVPKNILVSSIKEEVVSNSIMYGRPDVDKKADEFIAKFREQIRLQRIDSMKRSSMEIGNNSPRQD